MPGDSGVLVVTRVRSTTTKCTRDRGCSGHPAFPTPSLGREIFQQLGRIASRGANVCLELTVIAIYRILRECYGAPAGPAELWLGPRRSTKPGRVAMGTRPGSEVVSQNSRQFLTTTAIAIAAAVAGTVLATSALAQSAGEIRGPSQYVAVQNEPAPKLIVAGRNAT